MKQDNDKQQQNTGGANPNNTAQPTGNNPEKARATEQGSDQLVQQDGPLKNNDRDINGDAEQSWSHRNGAQE